MKKEELAQILQSFDTRLTTINERTKIHTLDIRKLNNRIKKLENDK